MKIEAGKYYKTRSGRKAYICAIMENPFGDGSSPYKAVGYIQGCAEEKSWTFDGSFNRVIGNGASDLVAPWQEPVRKTVWLHLVQHPGEYTCTVIDDKSLEAKSFTGQLIARKQITITEGEGINNL